MHYNITIKPEITLKAFFKTPSKKNHTNKTKTIFIEKNQEKNYEFKDNYILCRSCKHTITTFKEKINVNGFHNHTFANPNGIIFDIGCYKNAPGCIYSGHFTEEFSWFKAYKWKVSLCASCLSHLGWLFLSSNNDSFCGLIVDHLIESE